MIIGTSYFVSYLTAVKYYRQMGLSRKDVQRKLDMGEIHIGFPPLGKGDNLVMIDNGWRYAIQRD